MPHGYGPEPDVHGSATVGCVWLESLVQAFLASPLSHEWVQKARPPLALPHFDVDIDRHDSAIVELAWLENLVQRFVANQPSPVQAH